MNSKYSVGFIGCGNMGGALAMAVSRSDAAAEVKLYDLNNLLASGLRITTEGKGSVVSSASETVKNSDFVFIGVKPNTVNAVLDEIAPALIENPSCALVSMAAGISISAIKDGIAASLKKSECKNSFENPIIRIMPNTPVTLGEGVIGFASETCKKVKEAFMAIMEKAGYTKEVSEENIDAVTALSGCGPAFVYSFIEALASAGEDCGLNPHDALMLAAKTLGGAAKMVELTGIAPSELRRRVCSPGGATIEGVKVLENEDFSKTVKNAVAASFEKTKKLGNK